MNPRHPRVAVGQTWQLIGEKRYTVGHVTYAHTECAYVAMHCGGKRILRMGLAYIGVPSEPWWEPVVDVAGERPTVHSPEPYTTDR